MAALGRRPLRPTLSSPARSSYGSALASREFRALFAGQSISITGSSVAAVALMILVYRRTESPFLSALTFALAFLPYVLSGALFSSVVDRVHPRRLVVGCDLTSGLIAATMALPHVPVAALLALMLLLGTVSALAGGARTALVRSTVGYEAYVPARSLMRIAAQSAQIAGNAFGGALVVVLSPSGAILVNSASFVCSAAIVRLTVGDYPAGGIAERANVFRDSLRGARRILAHEELRRLLLLGWLVPTFVVAPEALAAPYVAARHGSATLVGVFLVALPAGIIAGDVAGVRFLSPTQQRRLIVPAAFLGFLPYLAFLAQPPLAVALPLLVVSGLCAFYSLGLDARVRDAVPEQLFARTMTLNNAGLMTLQGVGFALAGAVAQGIGPARAIAVAGVCGLVAVAATAPRS